MSIMFRAQPAATSPEIACSGGGVVVSACPIASEVGARILRSGGNAVDAAIAVGFVLAVTYPEAGNIGGGGFMLVRLSGGECRCIDYREKAPAEASRDMYLGADGEVIPDLSTIGHLSAGVPGTVAGLYLAHGEYGSLPWSDLIEPAAKLARSGFSVSERLAGAFERLEPHLADYQGLAIFTGADGKLYAQDDTLIQADLARTLERIASRGPEDFYEGETAELISREMARGGGLIDLEDLSSYEAVVREPVRGSYRGFEILSSPPPSSGGIVLLEILNILEGYPLAEYGFLSEKSVHLAVEAEKRAYRDRACHLGDSDYVNIDISKYISKEYAEHLRSDIMWRATEPADLSDRCQVIRESDETTHYSIIDGDGNAVSVTTTLNGIFGSMVVVDGAGFLMNNEMDDFSIKPGVPNMYDLIGGDSNAIAPGKRMLSSMTPTIVLRGGKPFIVLGSPGGGKIITTVAQIIMNVIDFGMSVDEAVDAPRFHHQWIPDRIEFEERAYRRELVDALGKRGQRCFLRSKEIGEAQVIWVEDSLMCGVADRRGKGRAVAENGPTGQ
jgi:gamma-glutamyltranspeptidase/glutathione hydrolase